MELWGTRPAWVRSCGSGDGSASRGSGGRRRTSRCCAGCAWTGGAGLTRAEFEDAIATCNLLPGPASTELAIFCAWRVRGRLGAVVGGLAFIVPGLILILVLSALFLAGAPPLWVRGAGAGAGAAVAAVAVQAGWSLLVPSWKRASAREPVRASRLRWAGYLLAGGAGSGDDRALARPGPARVRRVRARAAGAALAHGRGRNRAAVPGRAGRGDPGLGRVGGVQGGGAVVRRRVRDHPADAGRRGGPRIG